MRLYEYFKVCVFLEVALSPIKRFHSFRIDSFDSYAFFKTLHETWNVGQELTMSVNLVNTMRTYFLMIFLLLFPPRCYDLLVVFAIAHIFIQLRAGTNSNSIHSIWYLHLIHQPVRYLHKLSFSYSVVHFPLCIYQLKTINSRTIVFDK